jgi:hypothetical protein
MDKPPLQTCGFGKQFELFYNNIPKLDQRCIRFGKKKKKNPQIDIKYLHKLN